VVGWPGDAATSTSSPCSAQGCLATFSLPSYDVMWGSSGAPVQLCYHQGPEGQLQLHFSKTSKASKKIYFLQESCQSPTEWTQLTIYTLKPSLLPSPTHSKVSSEVPRRNSHHVTIRAPGIYTIGMSIDFLVQGQCRSLYRPLNWHARDI
jgi:hypothetical protein